MVSATASTKPANCLPARLYSDGEPRNLEYFAEFKAAMMTQRYLNQAFAQSEDRSYLLGFFQMRIAINESLKFVVTTSVRFIFRGGRLTHAGWHLFNNRIEVQINKEKY